MVAMALRAVRCGGGVSEGEYLGQYERVVR